MTTRQQCAILQGVGLKHVLWPEDEEYELRNQNYFSVSARLKPGCIVQPTTAEEVSLALRTVTAQTTCNFAVRGGGHTAFPGAANIQDGVTIDLGRMRNVTYDADKKVARIQPGPTWADVYGDLEPHGVTVAGGRTGTVGIGGFLTGGGNTFFAAQHGLGCDNVVNYEVVVANGDIINANKEENSDLFRALKGGGSNFGIITRFDMEAIEVGLLWGGLVTYDASTGDQFVDAYINWTDNIENYPEGSVIPFWSYTPETEGDVILLAYEDTTGVEKPAAFKEFMDIDNIIASTMRIDSHKNITDELEIAPGYRNIVFSFTFKNDKETFNHILEERQKFVKDWKAQSPDGDFYIHGIFQSMPTLFAKHGVAKGGNMLGLDRVDDNAMLYQIQMMVKGEEQEKISRQRLAEYFKELKQWTRNAKTDVDWIYLNYADYTQDPLPAYGEENVEHIRKVAKKFDPEGIFQTRMPGGFKISNVE